MKKRMISLLLSLVFVFTLLPTAVLAADEYSLSEDGTLTLTPDDLVDGASDEGWSFSGGILTINSGYTLVFDGGWCSCAVFNYGTISGGTFSGDVTNHGAIEGGTFSGEVENYGTIKGGTFNHEVFNHYLISGGTFTKQVTNDGTIENGTFDCNVANSDSGAIKGGNFNLSCIVENRGTIEGGIFSGSVSNYNGSTISGGVLTGGLGNYGTVTGTADLSNLYDLRDNGGLYGKEVKLPKAVIRGDLTYTGCESSTEITLHYYADGVKTDEWKVSGEKYSYPVEKYKRTAPDADLSAIEGITHKVEAAPMDGYEITVENPIWDRFHVTVAYIPELTITGISDGVSFPIGADIPFTAIGKGMDNDAPVEGVYQYRPYYWKVLDSSGAAVASGDWVESNTIEEYESYNASIDTDAMRVGRYTLIVACSEWQWQSGVWTPLHRIDVDIPESAYSTISIAFELYCNEHTGGTATCTEKAICSACGTPYGEVLGHDWGNWISNGDGTHTRACANDANHTETYDCSGGTATCTEKAKCTACGTAYGDLADHSFSADWIYDDTSHWHAATCGHEDTSDTAEHSYGGDRVCDICGYTKPAPYIPSEPTWRPEVDCGENGDVTVNPRSPEQGDRVTITTDPAKGYEVDEVIVTDRRGNKVRVTDKGDGTYSFLQPYGKVTITVTFKKEVCDGGVDCPTASFTDLDFGAWYHDGIHYCVEQGLMQGVGGDSFDPNGTTSRAMIWTILARLDGVDTDGEVWYEAGRKWAVENAISDGTMANDPITREQLATILWRYAKYKGYDVSVGENTNILSYEDAFDISEYAIPAMQWACGAGVIGGIEKNNSMYLDPQGSATRAQAATMLMRFCEMKK